MTRGVDYDAIIIHEMNHFDKTLHFSQTYIFFSLVVSSLALIIIFSRTESLLVQL